MLHSDDEGNQRSQNPAENIAGISDCGPDDSNLPVSRSDASDLSKIEEAIEAIGMGRYQWELFFVTGFGYFSDNLWPIVTGLILPAVADEFSFRVPFLKLGQNVGLLIGAAFWGIGADIWGRRLSFNITLLITGIFALAAGGSPSAVTLCALAGMWSIGVGGNLPIDSALFLESIPGSYHYLLTVLSIWWAFGQLVGSLVAWPLIANYSCTSNASRCPRSDNQGWRYFLFCMGGLMLVLWFIRFFVFRLYESPRWLFENGRVHDACYTLHEIATKNVYTGNLNLPEGRVMESGPSGEEKGSCDAKRPSNKHSLSAVIQRRLEVIDLDHIQPLFSQGRLAHLMTLLIFIWALIGLAFPLYNSFVTYYLATRGADFGDGSVYTTYRNVTLSVIGVPGALVAGFLVRVPLLGGRGVLSISTILTGTFILASTTARTSAALLLWNCAYSFTSNIMYGVLYAVTPELLPVKHRGTGNALCASANRVFGVMAPVVALYSDLKSPVPIFIAGGLFLVAGGVSILLPEGGAEGNI